MTTAEKRDIAGEHITLDEQAALVLKYKLTPQTMTTIVREQADQNIWKELGRMKHECLICGQIVDGTRPGGYRAHNTNFGRVSHGKKHVNDGSALSVWGGADGIRIRPSKQQVERYIGHKLRQRVIDSDLPKLRERRRVPAEQKRIETRERQRCEARLIDLAREKGPGALGLTEVREIMFDISDRTRKIDRLKGELLAIAQQFPKDVVAQLTGADL